SVLSNNVWVSCLRLSGDLAENWHQVSETPAPYPVLISLQWCSCRAIFNVGKVPGGVSISGRVLMNTLVMDHPQTRLLI
ncbi:mCG145694, partial [Mus musculus]